MSDRWTGNLTFLLTRIANGREYYSFPPQSIGDLAIFNREGQNHEHGIPAVNQVDFAQDEKLDFEGSPYLSAHPEFLDSFKSDDLTQLSLSQIGGATDKVVAHIQHLKGLRSLKLDGEGITNASLDYVDELPNLRYIEVETKNMSCSRLGKLKVLKSLDVLVCHHAKEILLILAGLKYNDHIRMLALYDCDLSDRDLSEIAKFRTIENLNICGSYRVTERGLASLSNLKNLRRLDIE